MKSRFRFTTALLSLVILSFVSSQDIQAQARIQFINASADPSITALDVWVNDVIVVPNFSYLQATPWLNIASAETLAVKLTDAGSLNVIWADSTTFVEGGVYVATIVGVKNSSRFAPNPDGRPSDLNIRFNSQAQEFPPANPAKAWFGLIHASTDLEGLEVSAKDAGILQGDIKFTGHTGYKSLIPDFWSILLRASVDTNVVYDSFLADLSAQRGKTLVMLFAGFLNPSANLGGPPFGIYLVNGDGAVTSMPINTAVGDDFAEGELPGGIQLHGNYPNPFNPSTRISFDLAENANVSLKVFDGSGRLVQEILDVPLIAGKNLGMDFNATALPSGPYFYQVTAKTLTGQLWSRAGTMSYLK